MPAVEEPNANARRASPMGCRRFGGVGEIKDLFDVLFWDAATRIVDIHVNVVLIMSRTDPQSLDFTSVHGMDGIFDEIDKSLAEIPVGSFDFRKTGIKFTLLGDFVFKFQVSFHEIQLFFQDTVHVEPLNLTGMSRLAPFHQGSDDLGHPGALLGDILCILSHLLVPITA